MNNIKRVWESNSTGSALGLANGSGEHGIDHSEHGIDHSTVTQGEEFRHHMRSY